MLAPNIFSYAEFITSDESALLKELHSKAYFERKDYNMLCGFYQGRLLSMFSKMIQPKCILEIGTYIGYSALCLAEGLTAEGSLITIDVNPKKIAIGQSFWDRSVFKDKIIVKRGMAQEILPTLEEKFDLIFIDADKMNYGFYYDTVFPKLKLGGFIIIDNLLWGTKVIDAQNGTCIGKEAKYLNEFNLKIRDDKRVSNILLPIRDGLMVLKKESE